MPTDSHDAPRPPDAWTLLPEHYVDPALVAAMTVQVGSLVTPDPASAELGMPPYLELVRVILEAPLGWQGYRYEMLGTFDVPPAMVQCPKLTAHDLFMAVSNYPHLYVWSRRVHCLQVHGYIEARWLPTEGHTLRLHWQVPPATLAELDTATVALTRAATLLEVIEARGRPHRDYDRCAQQYRAARRAVQDEKHRAPSQKEIAAHMGINTSTLLRWGQTFTRAGFPWPPVD